MKTNSLITKKSLNQLREDLLKTSPYSLLNQDKQKILNKIFQILTKHHYESCAEYQKILNSIGFSFRDDLLSSEFPFIPVRLFKEYELKSIKKNDIFKIMNSSGTSGQELSKIFLDKETASIQSKTLSKILLSFIGKSRLPMIIVDSEEVLKNKHMFSARGAGILGFSMFGRDKIFALDKNMLPNENLIAEFLERYSGQRILIFGFTFIIWQHLFNYFSEKGSFPDLSGSILVHGGGWKKLISESVTTDVFKSSLMKNFGIAEVHDYYGMIEQTGSIYMECEFGHLHSSIFSDVIIRDHYDFSEKSIGEKGIIQLLSIIPTSYPGHSILTEDEGVLLGVDDCKCGRKGKYFKVIGRIQNAEIRGCSDTYAAELV
jgi:phenylacetate-coenzyme A ligase PaaK-like adenylate-forming protein